MKKNKESLQDKMRRLKEQGNKLIEKMSKYAELEVVLDDKSVQDERENKNVQLLD